MIVPTKRTPTEAQHLDDYRCLVAIDAHLHFGRAAQSLGLSPSAFSRRLARLEADLDLSLVRRSTRSVSLTAAGSLLAREAKLALGLLDDAVVRARRLSGGMATLRVGVTWTGFSSMPMQASSMAARELDGIDVSFTSGPSAQLLDALRADQLDAVFARTPARTDGLRVVELESEPIVVAMPVSIDPRVDLAAPIDAAWLASTGIALFERTQAPEVWDALVSHLQRCSATVGQSGAAEDIVRFRASTEGEVFALALAEDVPALVTRSAAHAARTPSLRYAALDPSIELGLALVWRPERTNGRCIRAVRAACAELTAGNNAGSADGADQQRKDVDEPTA